MGGKFNPLFYNPAGIIGRTIKLIEYPLYKMAIRHFVSVRYSTKSKYWGYPPQGLYEARRGREV